jgi:hypothetical protein
VGGIGVLGLGVVGFGLAWLAGPPRACNENYDHGYGACDVIPPFFYGGLVTGVLAGAGGTAMIYYGALAAPLQPIQPAARLPWALPTPRGMSLGFRF